MIRFFRGGFAALALLALAFSDTACAQNIVTINTLPSATSPPSGSEVVPVWQLGATRKLDLAHILPNSGVTAGIYGDSTHCAFLTLTADGRVSSATNSASCPGGGGGGTPGGSNTQIQFNNSSAFGGVPGFTWNGTILTLPNTALGTPASGNASNLTNYPVASLAGLGTNVATLLTTPSSANLRAALTDETGTGLAYFQGGDIGTPSAGNGSNLTNLTAANINGQVAVANGGTGIASYAVGDLLYASGATTLSKLADIATTNVLLSGGVGVAPSWGKVANAALSNSAMTLCGTSTSLGGTLTASACFDNLGATQGQILYRNASTWVPLAPGTSGQVLTTGGAGANPAWAPSSGTGTLTTLTAGSGVLFSSGATCTTTCTISTTVNINARSTGYALIAADSGQIAYANSGSAVALSIAQANTAGFTAGAGWEVANVGAGQTTITAAPSTFGNGATTLLLDKGQFAFFASDSINYPITSVSLPVVPTDGVMGNFTGATNYPKWAILPSCSAGSSALTYNTTTHAFGCNTISGSGTVNSGTSGQMAYYASSGTAVSGSNIGTGVLAALGNNTNGAGGVCVIGANACAYKSATVGWIATVNPNGAGILVFPANATIISIVGNVETATGGTATVSVNLASSGTACSAGTTVHSGSFNANGTAATNQTLTLTTTAATSGQRLCIVTTGTTAWTTGTGIGTITVTYTVP